MFLSKQPKRSKLLYGAAAKSFRKLLVFVAKWMKRYLKVDSLQSG